MKPERAAELDVLCLGEPLGEFNAARGESIVFGHGGDVSNCAVAAARQGARAGMAGALGDDSIGRSFRALWNAEGIDTTAVRTDPTAPTGIYSVEHGPRGHEFSYWRAGSAASRMGPQDLPGLALARARVLHVSAIGQAISSSACDLVFAAIEAAHAAGAAVSYDTNLRLKLWPLPRARAIIQASAAQADIVLPGLEDARLLTGLHEPDAIADVYLRGGAAVVALTLGSSGALIATGSGRTRVPALVVDALDATGAGDCFDGAFLAEYLRSGDAFAAGRYAAAAAALSTRGYGAVAPIPRRAQVEAALCAEASRA